MARVQSQPLKWHGGKSYLANWLHSLAPPACRNARDSNDGFGYTHRNIVFAGGLGEFWNWEPIEGISEAVNDSDFELTNFYTALRNPDDFLKLRSLLEFTQLSQWNWESFRDAARDACDGTMPEMWVDSLSRAWWFFVRFRQSRQGLGKDYTTPTTRTRRGMNEQVSAWLSAVEGLPECHERLRRVEIRNMDCLEFIAKYDHPRALFYCDPPYLHETRSSTGEYREHEMSPEAHDRLLSTLATIKGKFMLSGYPSALYEQWRGTRGWNRHERQIDNKASSAKEKKMKTECVWTNY